MTKNIILFELYDDSNKPSQQKGLEMAMILTNLNGLDLDARLDMSLFRGLIDGVRQDLGFTEGVDESRTPGSRSACFICNQESSGSKRTGQHEVVAVDRTRHGMSREHSE